MKLFEKLFCKHTWKVHAKSKYRRGSLYMYQESTYVYTKEVLICEHCGKIKTIEY